MKRFLGLCIVIGLLLAIAPLKAAQDARAAGAALRSTGR